MYEKDGIIFRKMDFKDINGVVKIESRSFSLPWSTAMFNEELNNPIAFYIVAVIEQEIVGYAGMWLIIDEAHITNIAVDPKHRRRNIASTMVRLLIEKAREMNLKAMTLEVRTGNFEAIELYKRFGFKTEGLRKGYYREDGGFKQSCRFFPKLNRINLVKCNKFLHSYISAITFRIIIHYNTEK
jgi:ribosomal-protein-alanine N-acetyltransferase